MQCVEGQRVELFTRDDCRLVHNGAVSTAGQENTQSLWSWFMRPIDERKWPGS